MEYISILKSNFRESISTKEKFLLEEDILKTFDSIVSAVVRSLQSGGRIYIAGNGGSAADAQHLAGEFTSRLCRERRPLPAEALSVDTSTLTAIANDYGYEHVFSRQLLGKLLKTDCFIAFSTSGNSANIVRALETCRDKGGTAILFTGSNGGKASLISDFTIRVPSNTTTIIQEVHIMLVHSLCQCVEEKLFFYNEQGDMK